MANLTSQALLDAVVARYELTIAGPLQAPIIALLDRAIENGSDLGATLLRIPAVRNPLTEEFGGEDGQLDGPGLISAINELQGIVDEVEEASAAISLTSDVEAVDEGDAVNFTIEAAEGEDALAEGTEVAYTLSGVDADDIDGDLTGTAVIGADGTATVTVNLVEDQVTEGEETLTMSIDVDGTAVSTNVTVNDTSAATTFALSAAQTEINEGASNTFTVTASQPVAEDTTVTFELMVEGESASLEDFSAGAFNPVTVTIPAGETEATFDVEAITNDGTEASETYRVEAVVNGETLSQQVTLLDGSAGGGQTFQLTKDLDIIPGMEGSNGNTVTSGNDTIIGTVESGSGATLNATDQINAGDGTDTLKVFAADATSIPMANVSNVEVVEVNGTAGANIDTSVTTGVEQLNIVKAGTGAVTATAAAETDVTADLKDNGTTSALSNTIDGGNNVTVNASAMGSTAGNEDSIAIGGTTAAKGDVVVDATAVDAVNGNNIDMGAIDVDGGSTVSVTQSVGDASDLTAGGTATTHNQGDVTVVANASTSEVTVKQDAAVTAASTAAVEGKTEVANVKFSAVTSSNTATVGGLTFTAAKDLTAEEVAQAFAELSANAAVPTNGSAADTQGPSAVANGTFSGELVAGWNSGAANGDTVTFTAASAGNITNLTATNAAVTTPTEGVDAVVEENTLGVTAGVVDITDGAALTTVTVDSYSGASQIQGTGAKLETLNLSNGGDFTVADTADTLALSLEKVGSTSGDAAITLTTAPTTLDVTSTGDNYVDLDAAATETLNVSGTGTLKADTVSLAALASVVVTEEAGLTLDATPAATLTSVDTTGTTGTVTATIDGTEATYAGGDGVDNVTLETGSTAALTKAIDLGAGNDRLSFNDVDVTGSTAALEGGDGTDTLAMQDSAAAALDGSEQSFYTGFERLAITDALTSTLDLANLGFTDHVTLEAGASGGLSKLANNGTVVLTADATSLAVVVKDADTNATDTLNVELSKASGLAAGTVTANDIESINVTATDTDVPPATGATVDTHTMTLAADKATSLTLDGNAGLNLTLDATTTALTTIDGSMMTGALTAGGNGENAMTITSGSGEDVLSASVGTGAKADVLNGGAGDDTLYAGTNGASLTGGDGNDTFVVSASSATTGNKEANTYSVIEDFQSGDLLQLNYWDGAAESAVTSFGKLDANLNESTAVFSDFVNAAMEQTESTNSGAAGDAVWFSFNNDSYVVVDSGTAVGAGSFANGEDLVVQLAGVDLNDASFNSQFGTVAIA